jgi:hypothetical protein
MKRRTEERKRNGVQEEVYTDSTGPANNGGFVELTDERTERR